MKKSLKYYFSGKSYTCNKGHEKALTVVLEKKDVSKPVIEVARAKKRFNKTWRKRRIGSLLDME